MVQCLGDQEPEKQYAIDTASRISDLLARKAAEAHAKKHRTPPVRLADSAFVLAQTGACGCVWVAWDCSVLWANFRTVPIRCHTMSCPQTDSDGLPMAAPTTGPNTMLRKISSKNRVSFMPWELDF